MFVHVNVTINCTHTPCICIRICIIHVHQYYRNGACKIRRCCSIYASTQSKIPRLCHALRRNSACRWSHCTHFGWLLLLCVVALLPVLYRRPITEIAYTQEKKISLWLQQNYDRAFLAHDTHVLEKVPTCIRRSKENSVTDESYSNFVLSSDCCRVEVAKHMHKQIHTHTWRFERLLVNRVFFVALDFEEEGTLPPYLPRHTVPFECWFVMSWMLWKANLTFETSWSGWL